MRTSRCCWTDVRPPSGRCASAACRRYVAGSPPQMSPEWRHAVRRIEDLLRAEFGRADAPASRPDAMLARVARARRRRVAAAATGGGALLAGLAVAVYAALPGILPGSAPAGDGVPTRLYSDELINTIFTDEQHGYAVQQRCSVDQITGVPDGAPTPDVHEQCT